MLLTISRMDPTLQISGQIRSKAIQLMRKPWWQLNTVVRDALNGPAELLTNMGATEACLELLKGGHIRVIGPASEATPEVPHGHAHVHIRIHVHIHAHVHIVWRSHPGVDVQFWLLFASAASSGSPLHPLAPGSPPR